MPYIVPLMQAFQYSGTDGEAYAANFGDTSFVSEADGVLTLHFNDSAGPGWSFQVQAGQWMIANAARSNMGTGAMTDEYLNSQYVTLP